MPYLDKFRALNMFNDCVMHNVQFTWTGTGVVAATNLPPLDTVAYNTTGLVTVTFGDGPYFQCVGYSPGWNQAVLDAAMPTIQVIPPVDGTGNTATIQCIETNALANPTNALQVSVAFFFRQSPT